MSAYEARQAMLAGDMARGIALLKASVGLGPSSTPTTSVVNDTYTPPSSSSSSSSSASSSSSSSNTGTGNTNANGSTFQVIYDPANNKIVTVYPGGARSQKSLAAGETPSSAKTTAEANLKRAYNNIGKIVVKDESNAWQNLYEAEWAKADQVTSNTLAGKATYSDNTGTGIHSNDLDFVIKQGNASNRDEAVKWIAAQGTRVLSNYYSADKIAQMTDKQKAAAYELYHQGSLTSSGRRSNGLSVQDLKWIEDKANSYKGAVYSAGGKAISTGDSIFVNPTIKRANELGVSRDTRNWESIVASSDPVKAAAAATAQMFGGITVKRVSMSYKTDSDGNILRDDKGKPLLSAN